MIFKTQILRLCLVVILGLFCQKVIACDCIMYPVTSYIPTSEFIFIVKVKQVHKEEVSYYKGYRATVEVAEVLKGKMFPGQELEFDSIDNGNCTFVFDSNETYLLFAFKKNNKFYVYPCSYSEKACDSRKNIRIIKKYLRNKHNRV
ncbi:hypothetical protein [Chitinophaga sp. Ak27]|uniref:hypothetical protein n=1 Tax=Chitinophaga sp. Ak27 TaxID=2726116 RepID=UPI00145D56B8|nr:hypothetical protein [Chitinophaga sp. Ak27]NLU92485.1 hypothetical protein [Chitinophaga sp. Ak27]